MPDITFVDLSISPIEGAEYISSITWVTDRFKELDPHHYFVDYPGVKNLERQITDIIGGKPLVRYSCSVVIRTLLEDAAASIALACKTEKQKQLLQSLIKANDIKTVKLFTTFQDVIDSSKNPGNMIGFISLVESCLSDAKDEAAQKFGNAL